MMEAGYRDQESETLQGVYFPTGTPAAIVRKFHADLMKIGNMLDVRERVTGLGFDFVLSTPDEFMQQTRVEVEKWKRVINNAKVQIQ
jgi:tripartite-type tricarboxylate transporter receptor subunit TctC